MSTPPRSPKKAVWPRFDEFLLDPVNDYFTTDVAKDGYRWWYIDLISEDERTSVVVIGFIGSVFSPYYARARKRGPADPYAHCAINAIIYGPDRKRWAMTERGERHLLKEPQGIRVGKSAMQWQHDKLVIDIDEWTNPFPSRLRGRIEIDTGHRSRRVWPIHDNGAHHWWPMAPHATATAHFEQPHLTISGSAYVDSNFGKRPLERDFRYWDWTRNADHSDAYDLTYHTRQIDDKEYFLSLKQGDSGELLPVEAPRLQPLPKSAWRVSREICSEHRIGDVKTLEDTPFYARAKVTTDSATPKTLMHESLSLERFGKPWVQTLLPFRMPRRR
ncbi:MAG: carotenoid 1,2-hydratase [Pseudomonadota bacterium]